MCEPLVFADALAETVGAKNGDTHRVRERPCAREREVEIEKHTGKQVIREGLHGIIHTVSKNSKDHMETHMVSGS